MNSKILVSVESNKTSGQHPGYLWSSPPFRDVMKFHNYREAQCHLDKDKEGPQNQGTLFT